VALSSRFRRDRQLTGVLLYAVRTFLLPQAGSDNPVCSFAKIVIENRYWRKDVD